MPLTSEITAYDPKWPALFILQGDLIQAKMSKYITAIHHVGSTAIPGIKAKPEIDLLIIIKSLADISIINAGMADLGYDVRGECGIPGRFYYSKNNGLLRTHKAHACEAQHQNVASKLAFRDYLRDHPDTVHKYGELKLELHRTNTDGIGQYLEGKSGFIENIIQKALSEGYGPATMDTTNSKRRFIDPGGLRDLRGELHSNALRTLLEQLGYPEKIRNAKCDQIIQAYHDNFHDVLLGLDVRKKLAGLIGFRLIKGNTTDIFHIVVHKDFRKQGIGRKIIKDVISIYALKALRAETDNDAVGFYRKLGFDIQSLGEQFPGVERFACSKQI